MIGDIAFAQVDLTLADDMKTLHDAIHAIVPIAGFSLVNDVPSEIDYITPPTPEQQPQIDAVINGWELLRAKNAQLRKLDANWQATISAGWVTPHGWKLGLDISDVTLLSGAFMLAKEAANMGIDTPAHIIDTDGATHALSLAELTTLMLGYGQARAAASAADAAVRQAINNAATLAELNAVIV